MTDAPEHPGQRLLREVIEPLGLNLNKAAHCLAIDRPYLKNIIEGTAAISAKLAVKLEKSGKGNAEEWRSQQRLYDAWKAAQKDARQIEAFRKTVTVPGFPEP